MAQKTRDLARALILCFVLTAAIAANAPAKSREQSTTCLAKQLKYLLNLNEHSPDKFVTADAKVILLKKIAQLQPSLDQFASTRYGRGGLNVLQRLRALSPGFGKLIVDPGLTIRLDEFEAFVKTNNLLKEDPWHVRDKFKQFLGETTLYRALALTPEEFETIQRVGIGSKLAHLKTLQANYFEKSLNQEMDLRVTKVGGNWLDPLMSVTDYPDVANAVASRYASPGKKVYLFTLKVPELDIIYQSFHSEVMKYPYSRASTDLHVVQGGKRIILPFPSRKVESFLLYYVSPNQIVSSQLVEPESIPEITFVPCFGPCKSASQ
ncbi:hypothetical protein WDW86_05060 [Bdellovibrionota bacterium FG-2]